MANFSLSILHSSLYCCQSVALKKANAVQRLCSIINVVLPMVKIVQIGKCSYLFLFCFPLLKSSTKEVMILFFFSFVLFCVGCE
ncbi:Dolabradiene synthase KSL4, chloroplastic [Frankliniella fusca]|uniref:Dolabradiene synthase KSL4, chloroplastic n=1 Tax=Frankliniella fusca TaxID=407009 RepID=A0AAE1LIV3_9NEOP|nr:Dolabradiene synthase KSL4, chloroplastic [Frankliniella fusca]